MSVKRGQTLQSQTWDYWHVRALSDLTKKHKSQAENRSEHTLLEWLVRSNLTHDMEPLTAFKLPNVQIKIQRSFSPASEHTTTLTAARNED